MEKKVNIDWNNLGFNYIKTDYRFISHWKNGEWDKGTLTKDNVLHISEGSTALHYGQQSFEGLKAYRTKDGAVQLFRPDENAKRMQKSADRLLMPSFPVDKFIEACKQVVAANEKYVPPYDSGGTLYLRPLLIGVGDNIGVRASSEYIFTIFCTPVGPYFKGGITPVNFLISDYDRAAPHGTGAAKVGGNYAASLYPNKIALNRNFADSIYLDPTTHTRIEEVGSANFFGITKDNVFVTPESPSILRGITKISLIDIAKNILNLDVEIRDVFVDKLSEFKEAGACGTAAVITPIGGIQYGDKFHVFHSETEVGPIVKKLYSTLSGIQFGDLEAPNGWIVKI